jgi:hypothetical protein
MPHTSLCPAAPPKRRPCFPRRPPPQNPAATPTPPSPPRSLPAGLTRGGGPRTRSGRPCRSPAIHGKLRYRMNGVRGRGPRTPESLPRRRPGGRIRVRRARTIHGNYGANARAENRYRVTLLCISRVDIAARRYRPHLRPAFATRHRQYPRELMPPPLSNGAITAAEDHGMRHAVAASRAPWRAADTSASSSRRAASSEIRTAS